MQTNGHLLRTLWNLVVEPLCNEHLNAEDDEQYAGCIRDDNEPSAHLAEPCVKDHADAYMAEQTEDADEQGDVGRIV